MSTTIHAPSPAAGTAAGASARLTDAGVERVARRFAVLAEPMRLRLLQDLFAGEKSVGRLVVETGGTPANVSRHLQTLRREGMLRRRKAGPRVFYAIADPSVRGLCEQMCGTIRRQLADQAEALAR